MKHNISNLVIEVTRKCNMACAHCLRGCAENMNIDHKHIDSLLSQVEYINMVTFTGGEPSLNVEAISYTLSECKRLGIGISSFYIATNGMVVDFPFVEVCLKLFAYCEEKEMCQVDVSNDMYHAAEGGYNTGLLDGLSFFKRKFEEEQYDYRRGQGIIAEGNGVDYAVGGRFNVISSIDCIDDLQDTEVYLNCQGMIINGCDWSYDSQDTNEEIQLCEVGGLSKFIESLEE